MSAAETLEENTTQMALSSSHTAKEVMIGVELEISHWTSADGIDAEDHWSIKIIGETATQMNETRTWTYQPVDWHRSCITRPDRTSLEISILHGPCWAYYFSELHVKDRQVRKEQSRPVIGRCGFDSCSNFVIFPNKSLVLVEAYSCGCIHLSRGCESVDKWNEYWAMKSFNHIHHNSPPQKKTLLRTDPESWT